MMPQGGRTPDAQGRGNLPEKGKRRRRMDAAVGQEAVELIAHYVGYRLDQKALRGQEASRLREAGYFKKVANFRRAWREAVSKGNGRKIISLLQEKEALRSQRREITAPLAPARREIQEGLTFVTKVGFPEVLRQAGVEPIRHL
jgi:hypothetical protein